jgi:hypothetical protein
MDICVVLKNKERQAWTGVLAIMRLAPDIVLLHGNGSETVYPMAAVKSISLA